MNYFRLGMSESSLLFLYFIEKNIENYENYEKALIVYYRKQIFNWFYTTSGFFDINIQGKYFNFDDEYYNIINSFAYNEYFRNLLEFIKNNEFKKFYFKCHPLFELNYLLPKFFEYIKKENNMLLENIELKENESQESTYYVIREIIKNNFEGKTILLIHNLSELMIEQYNNGNVKKLNPSFPNIKNIIPLKIGYTFLNTPLECDNIIERSKIINECINEYIKIYNIDFVVISCGAYSSLIAKELQEKIQYFMVGGELEKEFGIITNRHKEHISQTQYHVCVPDELKPNIHNLIENSCYW